MEDACPIRERDERFYSQVDAGFPPSRRERLHRHIRAGDAGVPPIGFPADRDGLGRPFNRAMKANANAPDLGEAEDATVQHRATAILRVGETVVAVTTVEAWIA